MSMEKNNEGREGAPSGGEAAAGAGRVTDSAAPLKVHLLDIGGGKGHQYGDCALCQFGDVSVLFDGGHRGDDELVLRQLKRLLGQSAPVRVTLIVVSHPHDDHIGCLPSLVAQGELEADWALVADPQYRWGDGGDGDNNFGDGARGLAEAVLEHDRSGWDDDELAGFVDRVANLETRYRRMLAQLEEAGTTVVLHGTDKDGGEELVAALADAGVGLEVFGPSLEQLRECYRLVRESQRDSFAPPNSLTDFDPTSDAAVAGAYRSLVAGVTDAPRRNRGAINLQSLVTRFEYDGRRVLFAGDMQFADPQVESQLLLDGVDEMRRRIRDEAPYAFVKLSHHGSDNAFSDETFADYGETKLYGICCGDHPGHHPHPDVLDLLDGHRRRLDWVRTDRNGLVTITFDSDRPRIELSRGRKDDETTNMGAGGGDDVHEFARLTDSAPPPAGVTLDGGSPGGSTYQFSTTLPPNASRLSVTLDLVPQQAGGAGGSQAFAATADVGSNADGDVVHQPGEVPAGELTPNSADDVESEPGSAEFLFADADCNVPWRAASSLLTLRDQVNRRAPRRNKASDGTIGDVRHCQQTSDHNPWVRDGRVGVVTALDITHDPAGGCDANTIAEAIRASRDPRVKYIIWNRRIANSAAIGGAQPWAWRPYNGTNPHTRHVHISVRPDKASYDSTAVWSI